MCFFFFISVFVSLDKCPATEVHLCSTWYFISALGNTWEDCVSCRWSSPWTDSTVRRPSAKDLGCLEQFQSCCSVLALSKRNQLRVNTRRLLFDRRLTAWHCFFFSFLFDSEHLTLQEIRNFPAPNLCSLYFQTLLAPAQGKWNCSL